MAPGAIFGSLGGHFAIPGAAGGPQMALSLQSQHHLAHLTKVSVFLVVRSEARAHARARARLQEDDFGPRWQPWWASWRALSVLAASKRRPGAGRSSCTCFERTAPPNILIKVCFRLSRKLLDGALAAVSAQFPACTASECCLQNRCRTPPVGHNFQRKSHPNCLLSSCLAPRNQAASVSWRSRMARSGGDGRET